MKNTMGKHSVNTVEEKNSWKSGEYEKYYILMYSSV